MLLQDAQMIVVGFRHKKFGIWSIFGLVMTNFGKNWEKSAQKPFQGQMRPFLTQTALTQSKMVQIPIFLCLKPTTIICASLDNIYFTFMVILDGYSGGTTLKTFKN